MKVCPDQCSGGTPNRQHQLTEGQLTKLSEAARVAVKSSAGSAYRCNYCGCVYLRGASTTKLGDLDGGITGEGWTSSIYP